MRTGMMITKSTGPLKIFLLNVRNLQIGMCMWEGTTTIQEMKEGEKGKGVKRRKDRREKGKEIEKRRKNERKKKKKWEKK